MAQRTGSPSAEPTGAREAVSVSTLPMDRVRIAATPEAFDGNGDWREWLTAFEVCADLNGWTDGTKLQWLQLRLVGAAGRTFRRLPADARLSFVAAKRALSEALEAPGQQLVNETAFRLKRRTATESWASHAETLLSLAERAYPQLDSSAIDAIVNAQLLQSVDDPHLQYLVRRAMPASVADSVRELSIQQALQSTPSMAVRLPSVLVKKPTEAIYYTWTDRSLDEPFFLTFTRCLNGSWVDKKESNGLILSFMCFQHSLNARGIYADSGYKMLPRTLTKEELGHIETAHLAKPYKDEFLGAVNLAIMYLVLGKNVGPEFRSRWAQVRAQSLYKIMEEEWRPGYEEQLITEEWARNMDRLWDNSRALREGVLTTILLASRSQVPDHRYYQYLVIMLRYACITGLYLIREFLVQDKVHPILEDAYLQADRARLREALLLWLRIPMPIRNGFSLATSSYYLCPVSSKDKTGSSADPGPVRIG